MIPSVNGFTGGPAQRLDQEAAARVLAVDRKTLYRKLKRWEES